MTRHPLRSMSVVLAAKPLRLRILRYKYVDGMTEKEIARRLNITKQGVNYHLRAAYKKLGETRNLVIDF